MARQVLPVSHRRDIDALRGIAVLLVVGFHAFPSLVPGGWLGVDVFFAISGFVIASLIYRQLDNGDFSLKDFAQRRLRRLGPALILVIGVVGLGAWLFFTQEAFTRFALSAVASLGFVSNLFFWTDASYFDNPPDENPLLHLWSIGIEAQFYVLFPLLVILAFRIRAWPAVGVALGAAIIMSLGLALSGTLSSETVFYLLPTRAWELLAGALVAWLVMFYPGWSDRLRPRAPGLHLAIVAAALASIVVPAVTLTTEAYTAADSLVPIIGTLVLLWLGASPRDVSPFLTWRAFVGLGLVSYSMYLWHWPLLVLGREVILDFSYQHALAILGLSLLLSVVSWRFAEQPFRDRQRRSRPATRNALVASGLIVGAGAVAVPAGVLPAADIEVHSIDVAGYVVGGEEAAEDRWDLVREKSRNLGPGCDHRDFTGWFDDDDPRANILIIGNSHSRDVYNVLAQSQYVTSQYQVGRMGCQLVNMVNHPGLLESETYTRADAVILASRLSDIDIDALPEIVERIQADSKQLAIVAPKAEVQLETPESWMWIDLLVYRNQHRGPDRAEIARAVNAQAYDYLVGNSAAFEAEVEEIAAQYAVPVLDRTDYICDPSARICDVVSDSLEKYYYDEDHHSLSGAAEYAQRLQQLKWLDPLTTQLGRR